MSYTPVLSAFTGSVLGQTAELQWAQVSTIYSNSVVYDLEYKLSTDANYSMLASDIDAETYIWASKCGNCSYNFRLRPKLHYLYTNRNIIGSRNITSTRNIQGLTAAVAYGSYYLLTLTMLYNYYVKGYNGEYIEIPGVFTEELADDTGELSKTLGGLYIRNQQNGSKNIITLETRPSARAKTMKLYSFIKSRMNQKETVYISSLKKEITAFVDIKKHERNNNGNRDLYSLSITIQEA